MTAHVVSTKTYATVFGALLALTLVTTGIALYDLGWNVASIDLNTIAALTIAVSKATMVVLYFMHVRYSSRMIWVFVGAGVFWLLILLGLTMSDVLTRQWIPALPPWGLGSQP